MAAKFILIIALLKLIAAADIEPDPLQQQVPTGCIGGDCVNGSATNAAFSSLKSPMKRDFTDFDKKFIKKQLRKLKNTLTNELDNLNCYKGPCPLPFEMVHGFCYYFSSDHSIGKKTWPDARDYCTTTLATLVGYQVDLAELVNRVHCNNNGFLMQKISQKNAWAWLGATGVSNVWTWNSGQSLSVMNSYWGYNQPGHHAPGNCLVAYTPLLYGRMAFGDWPCTTLAHFVCQLF